MRMDYNILWIDDRPKQVESAIEFVKIRLARMGFDLQVKMIQEVGNDKSLKKHFEGNDFDLLVVDYKMQAEARNGNDLIRAIRRFCNATDIVFYSSNSPDELRKTINVDGVYCANRNHLHERLQSVIHSTIKKTLDLNQMRGLYLAAVADFDYLIDELINKGYDKLSKSGTGNGFVNQICDTAIEYHKGTKNDLEKLDRDHHISAYTHLLSSNVKHKILLDILNELNDSDLDYYLSKFSKYSSEIIEPRNKLAHSMEKEFSSGEYILQNNKKEIKFTNDDFTNLRLKVLKYKDIFNSINNLVKVD